jgi:hypothetical protein
MDWKECENSVGNEESQECSDSLFITKLEAHWTYLGLPISDMCTTLASIAEGNNNAELGIEEINEIELFT